MKGLPGGLTFPTDTPGSPGPLVSPLFICPQELWGELASGIWWMTDSILRLVCKSGRNGGLNMG